MTAFLVYLLLGCWSALGLSFYGRWKGLGPLPTFSAIGVVFLWWVLLLAALFELFEEALVDSTSDDAEEGAHG